MKIYIDGKYYDRGEAKISVFDHGLLYGTGAEIMPVTKIDGRLIGTGEPGPVTKRLIKGFRDFIATQG